MMGGWKTVFGSLLCTGGGYVLMAVRKPNVAFLDSVWEHSRHWGAAVLFLIAAVLAVLAKVMDEDGRISVLLGAIVAVGLALLGLAGALQQLR